MNKPFIPTFIGVAVLCLALMPQANAAEQTVGGGSIDKPAVGPAPSFKIGGTGFVLVKNWDFGKNGTIKNMADMTTHFQYQDQWGVICNGTDNYGSLMVAADATSAVKDQPIEDPKHPVREFLKDSLKTYLVPLNGATTIHPSQHNVGSGSFVAKWKLPNGGSLLKQDMIFETRVRYKTPPYFWFAIWNSGNKWDRGAEFDLIESFGYDNGGGHTNYDGRFWHSDAVGGSNMTHYRDWETAMKERGVLTEKKPAYDATQWHTWTWLYRKDDTYSAYVDGIEVQTGKLIWTLTGKPGGEPIDMSFLFDGAWGHTKIDSVNRPLPASELDGKYYEWDYSRVYLRN